MIILHHEIDPGSVKFTNPGAWFEYSGDSRVDIFCHWLVDDVQNDPPHIVEIADALGRRMAGQTTEVLEFSGNAWFITVAADGVEAANMFSDDQAWLPLNDAAIVVYRYWQAAREYWRPARFDKVAKKFANRNQIEPLLPWELEAWDLAPA